MKAMLACERCGAEFFATKPSTRFCSARCFWFARKGVDKQPVEETREQPVLPAPSKRNSQQQ